ncbi:hypothetical protein Mgra_00008363 [Meloidogyne graminicola]|uniref:Uncharacterized protein n=1 Tax=Meloidogyne graminicola TaxID=189291 RepID=A0A8S9ZG40_9BILA|nr:hypothetical protein Mgra_00008363 [Meloidogyne graminicola]
MKIYLFILLISTFAFYVCNASDQNNLSWPRILRGEGNQDTARRATLNHLIGHGPSSTNASTPRVQGQGRNNRQREGGNRRNGNRRNVNNPDSRTRGQILQPNNFEHQGRVHQGNNNSNQFNRNNDSRHFAQPVLGVPLYGEAIGYPYQNEVSLEQLKFGTQTNLEMLDKLMTIILKYIPLQRILIWKFILMDLQSIRVVKQKVI